MKKVKLIDFSPFCEETDTLLFEWEELESPHNKEEEEVEHLLDFRIITSQGGIIPSQTMRSMLPYDLVDISEGSALSDMIDKIKHMQVVQEQEEQ